MNQELERFISDWYYDEKSHAFARQIGAFLLEFVGYLKTTRISERTIRKHRNNCWLIGKFVCDYGSRDTFSPAILLGGPSYLYEFRRKVSDSSYALDSYKCTWRKLGLYIRSLGYGSGARVP